MKKKYPYPFLVFIIERSLSWKKLRLHQRAFVQGYFLVGHYHSFRNAYGIGLCIDRYLFCLQSKHPCCGHRRTDRIGDNPGLCLSSGHQCGGYCSGSQTYRCGQNLGAKQPDRAAKAVWKTSTYNVFFMGVLSVVFLIWPRSVVEVFSAVPKVIDVGVLSLQVLLQAIFSMPLGWS